MNGTEWAFKNPTPGIYTLTLSATKPETVFAARSVRAARRAQYLGSRPAAETLDGVLVVWNESPDMLYAHVTNANLPVVGSMVSHTSSMGLISSFFVFHFGEACAFACSSSDWSQVIVELRNIYASCSKAQHLVPILVLSAAVALSHVFYLSRVTWLSRTARTCFCLESKYVLIFFFSSNNLTILPLFNRLALSCPDLSPHTHAPISPHLTNYQIGVAGKMVDNEESPMEAFLGTKRSPPASSDMTVSSAVLEAVFPDGTTTTVPMHDDGLHNDGAPNDHEYGGLVMATEPGLYRFRATLQGNTSEGHPYERVFVHELNVDIASISFKSMAVANMMKDNSRIQFRIPMRSNVPHTSDTTFRPYFELWGKGADGEEVPVTFATTLAGLSRAFWFEFLELEVDMRWVTLANITGPLTLKNVYVQNVDSLATQAAVASLPVYFCGEGEIEVATELPTASTVAGVKEFAAAAAKHTLEFDGEVTWEMRNGVAPPRTEMVGAEPTLVLLHGFCADKNPFEVEAADWTQASFYSAAREGDDLGRSNSQFANDVLAWIERQGIDTFGLVGQSQGGMISLHILNYFHTGLDRAVGERKLQSIATPFMGNTALTNLNGIIDIIGGVAGCSGPYDLTRSGAMEWNAGITNENADQTNYYYTEYKPGGLFGGGWCNTLMNVLLNGKNDGVCEVAYVSPDGRGTDQGNTQGWCHAEDMEWPPSFWDHERNAEMNTKGAR
jgi:hypothetical protein